jgi:hypothetical protein
MVASFLFEWPQNQDFTWPTQLDCEACPELGEL